MAFARVNTRRGKPKPVTMQALLDSSASETLINKKYVQKLKIKKDQNSSTVWSTPGGEMKTNEKAQLQFTLPELQDCKLIKWNVHVAGDMGAHDMSIGRDLFVNSPPVEKQQEMAMRMSEQ